MIRSFQLPRRFLYRNSAKLSPHTVTHKETFCTKTWEIGDMTSLLIERFVLDIEMAAVKLKLQVYSQLLRLEMVALKAQYVNLNPSFICYQFVKHSEGNFFAETSKPVTKCARKYLTLKQPGEKWFVMVAGFHYFSYHLIWVPRWFTKEKICNRSVQRITTRAFKQIWINVDSSMTISENIIYIFSPRQTVSCML